MTAQKAPGDRATDGEGPAARRAFCGYCGLEADPGEDAVSRVCDRCGMGLLLRAASAAAPRAGEAFLVVDELMAIRALSREAEQLLGATETAVVGRPVTDVLAPAGRTRAASSVTAAIAAAMRQGAAETTVAMRPQGGFGPHFLARVVACEPGPAALVVVAERIPPPLG